MDPRGPLTFEGLSLDEDDDGVVVDTPLTGTSHVSSMFATPLSRAASQAPGKAGESSRVKVGLLLVRDTADYCRGKIKTAGAIKWCTKSPRECQTKGHERTKVILQDHHFYIKCPKAGQARHEPALYAMSGSIPEKDDKKLDTSQRTTSVWISYIRMIQGHEAAKAREKDQCPDVALGEEPTGSWEQIDPSSLDSFQHDEENFQTPARPTLRRLPRENDEPAQELSLESLEELIPSPDELSDSVEDMLPRWTALMARDWPKVKSNFVAVG